MKRTLALAVTASLAVTSCRGAERDLANVQEPVSVPPHSMQSAPTGTAHRVPQAEARLATFLDYAVVSNPEEIPYSPFACEPEGATEKTLALASWRILSSVMNGDTAVVAAEIVSSAEEVPAEHIADMYTVDVRIRTDTLHYPMLKGRDGQWGICYRPYEDYGFLLPNDPPEILIWRPYGGSWARVIALADSVRRVAHAK